MLTTNLGTMKNLSFILFLAFCVSANAQQLYPFKSNTGKFGFKNQSGKVILTPIWDSAEHFVHGKSLVKQNSKIFLINLAGEQISSKFDFIGDFELGLAIVSKSGKYGLIDVSGRLIYPPKFEQADLQKKIIQYTKNKQRKLCGVLNVKPKEKTTALADSLFSKGQYAKSIELYKKYLAVPKASFKIYNNMAFANTMLGQEEKGAFYYLKALEYKEDPIVLYKLAGFYYMHQKYQKSLAVYERALKIHPNNAGMLYSMAKTCSKLGYYERSYALTLKASQIDPENFAHFFNLSYYSLFTNRPKMAIKAAKQSLALAPKETGAYTNLVLGYVLNNQFDEAEPIYKYWKDKYFFEIDAIGKEAFLGDIRQLEKMNIKHPDFKKVRNLLNE